jgi:MinD superfamily P-loop ATPase
MARVFFVTGSKGGVGKSVGAIALLDYFEMRTRQVSLVEINTANPNVGKAYQKDEKSFLLVNLDENEGWCSVTSTCVASPQGMKWVQIASCRLDSVLFSISNYQFSVRVSTCPMRYKDA